MGPPWVLSASCGPHVGPMKLAIWGVSIRGYQLFQLSPIETYVIRCFKLIYSYYDDQGVIYMLHLVKIVKSDSLPLMSFYVIYFWRIAHWLSFNDSAIWISLSWIFMIIFLIDIYGTIAFLAVTLMYRLAIKVVIILNMKISLAGFLSEVIKNILVRFGNVWQALQIPMLSTQSSGTTLMENIL